MNVDSRVGSTGHSWVQSVSADRADAKRTSTMQRPKTVIDYVTSGARPVIVMCRLPFITVYRGVTNDGTANTFNRQTGRRINREEQIQGES